MAAGEKLKKIFGAIGSGLSFIPGPWSALGMAFSAAGTAAGAVDQAKQQRELEEQQRKQQQAQVTAQLAQMPDQQRPTNASASGAQPTMAGPQSAKIFGQANPRYNLGQMGENMDNSVMQMLIKESGGWYDG